MALTAVCCRVALQARSDSGFYPLEDRKMAGLLNEQSHEEENGAGAAVAGASAASAVVPKASVFTLLKRKPTPVDAIAPAASESDLLADLVHKIKILKKDEAIARLGTLEETHEQNFFEIGGVLSAIQKNKWFEPHASFDEWVEKNTAMRRSKARVLVQIYDGIDNSGVTWAKVKHIGWTKLRAIAGVLKPDNADHWIGIASKHTKAEIIELVRQHLSPSGVPKASSSKATHSKTFKLHGDQIKTVNAAIEKRKTADNLTDDADALESICQDYLASPNLEQALLNLPPEALGDMLAKIFNKRKDDNLREVIETASNRFSEETAMADD